MRKYRTHTTTTRLTSLLVFFWLFPAALMAQEICNNGIDDDGDGFVDCYDTDCAGTTECSNFFITDPTTNCPPGTLNFSDYSVTEEWRTDVTEVKVWDSGNLITGDLNNDGIVEIYTTRFVDMSTADDVADADDRVIVVISGSDGSLIEEFDAGGFVSPMMAIADVEDDGCGELFYVRKVSSSGTDFELVSVDCDYNEKWATDLSFGNNSTGSEQIGSIYISDLNEDGVPEVMVKAYVFNAVTGVELGHANGNGPNAQQFIMNGPIAGDFLEPSECANCDGLELIVGPYAVAFDPIGQTELTPRDFSSDYDGKGQFVSIGGGNPGNAHFASMADVDKDGFMDVVMTGFKDNGSAASQGGFLYYWDVQDVNKHFSIQFNTSVWGPARPALGDIDGDTDSEAVFVHDNQLLAYDIDVVNDQFVLLWSKTTSSSKGLTSPTLFDFTGDGAWEVVYRDEETIYIIDGATGTELYTVADPCYTNSFAETPVIADVDGDGDPEILVSCLDVCDAGNDCSNYANEAHIRAYGATLPNEWVSARKVWNQHGYQNTAINDDLTVPVEMQDHSLVFSSTLCDGTAGNLRPLNNFLAQSPYLTPDGCPANAQADISVLASEFTITAAPTCPAINIEVEVGIYNSGDLTIAGAVPVSFYKGNPEVAAAGNMWLYTDTIPMNIPVGDTAYYTFTVPGDGSEFDLWVVANDNGTEIPGINYPTSAVYEECNANNNMASVAVVPDPFTLSAEMFSPNLKCADSLDGVYLPDNGSVGAYVWNSDSSAQITAGYDFYWYNGSTVPGTGVPDFIGANYTGLAEGFYTVFAENQAKGCNSDTLTIEVIRLSSDTTLSGRIDEVSVNSSCDNPNGVLKVIVNPTDNTDSVGDAPALYNFRWEQSTIAFQGSIISSTENATGIESGLPYIVTITDKATGCNALASLDSTGSAIEYPVPEVQFQTNNNYCVDGNAYVLLEVAGDTLGFDFEWYDENFLFNDYTGGERSGLTAGDYGVIAVNQATGCDSAITVTITDSLLYPELTLYENIANRSCDASNPDGALTIIATERVNYTCCGGLGQATDEFTAVGDASVADDSTFQITPDAGNQSGAAWFNNKISLDNDFLFEFQINLGDQDADGADGIAFVFQNDPAGRTAFGREGQGLGAERIDPGLAIEFDTWFNGGYDDLRDGTGYHIDHTSVNITNDYRNPIDGPYILDPSDNDVEDGLWHDVEIRWTAATNRLQMSFDGNGLIDISQDFVNTLFGGDEFVYFGFTGSTGGFTNDQQVRLINIVATSLQSDTNNSVEWFDGSNTTNSLNSGAFDNDSVAVGLNAGIYTIRVVGTETGCETVEDFEVLDGRNYPTVDPNDIVTTPNANCDSLLASGTIDIEDDATTESPVVGVISNTYTYQWWFGDNAVGPADYTTQDLSNLVDGNYTVVATNSATSCPSSEITVTVGETKEYPVVSFTEATLQTHCDPLTPNARVTGQATMPTIGEPVGGYTYAFYDGQTTNAGSLLVNDSTDDGLAAGIYTLYALNNDTGCDTTGEVTISNFLVNPAIDRAEVAITNWTNCDPDSLNGAVAAGISTVLNSNGGTYTFNWYDGPNAAAPIAQSDSVYGGLADGTYTLQLISDSTSCVSNPESFVVIQDVTYPVSAAAITQQHSCDPAQPNGALLGSATEVDLSTPTNGYSYNWFLGQNTLTSQRISTADSVESLSAGIYTLLVTNLDNACTDTTEWTVVNAIFDPIINPALVDITAQTTCVPPNGALNGTLSVSQPVYGDPTAGYTYAWYVGDSAVVWELDGDSTTATYSGLEAGEYTFVVTNNDTYCVSDEATLEVPDSTLTIDITRSDFVIANTCFGSGTPATGALGYQASSSTPPTAGFQFDWYRGQEPFPNPTPFATFAPLTAADTAYIDTLSSDQYTVRVTNLDDGCLRDTTLFLPRNDGHTIEWDSLVNSTLCPDPLSGFGNGQWFAEVGIAPAVSGLGINPTDYLFELYVGNNVLGTANADTIFSTNVDSALNGGPMFAHLAPGTYTFTIRENNSTFLPDRCPSEPVTFDIEQDVANPALALTTTNDISCVDSLSSGILEVDIDGNPTPNLGYSIAWYDYTPVDSVTGGTLNASNEYFIDSLLPAQYLVYVFDSTTNCESRAVGTILDDPQYIYLDLNTYSVTQNDQNCSPANGFIRIDSVLVEGTPEDPNDHLFYWYQGNDSTLLVGADSSNEQTGLTADTYYVSVASLITGCETVAPVQKTLINTATPPSVRFRLISSDNYCGGSGNGSFTAYVDSAGVEVTAGYTFTWYQGSDTTGTLVGNTPVLSNMNSGSYTVVVTDTTTPNQNCVGMGTYNLQDQLSSVTINLADVTITNQRDCNPVDGAITVNAVREDGVAQALTNYSFDWRDANLNILAGSDTTNAVSDLPFALYQVRVTNTVTSCVSDFVEIEVKDRRRPPVVEFFTTADATCPDDPFWGSGTLAMSVTDADSNLYVNGYDFVVYYGDSTSNALPGAQYTVGTSQVVVNTLGAGEYTVVVTDTTSPGLNCSYSATTIVLEEDISLPRITGFTTTPQDLCNPPNGAIQVNGVSQTSTLGFTFEWYDGTYDTSNVALTETAGMYSGLSADQPYFVTVYNEDTRCLSQTYQVAVADSTEPPIIDLESFTRPFRCANADDGGILTISADGSMDTGDYLFEWYNGPMPMSGGIISNSPTLSGQTDGTYSVRVTNQATLCVDSTQYRLGDEILDVPAFAFATPRSNCVTANGIITAFVELNTETDGLNYQYDWTNAAGNLFNTGTRQAGEQYQVFGRNVGRFTVVATDVADPFCVSDPIEVQVTDTRFDPDITITEDQEVTYCVNPNGQFTARVDSTEVNGYYFEWFAGTNTNNVAPINIGNILSGLEANNTYSVRVTNVINQCSSIRTRTATNSIEAVPPVTATVLAQNTSCMEFNPSGSASVSINATPQDYVFSWYEGTDVEVSPFDRGQLVTGLFNGVYTVNAQDRETGCISPADQFTILEQRSFPEFTLDVTAATCRNDDGIIRLDMVTDKPLLSIIWDDGFQVYNGAVLNGRRAGDYTVSVIDRDGCVTTEQVSIPTEVEVFNSVTPNGDGRNDVFTIGCLDPDETNNVKIYNRAGALVFEADNYDGQNGTGFIGTGNRGLYLGDQELPEGTYFYILTRDNGAKPVTGYLELIR